MDIPTSKVVDEDPDRGRTLGYIYGGYVTHAWRFADPTAQQGVPDPAVHRRCRSSPDRPGCRPAGAVLAPAVGAVPVAAERSSAGSGRPGSDVDDWERGAPSSRRRSLRSAPRSPKSEKIQQRQSELTGDANIASGAAPTDSLATELTPVVTPALLSARDQSIGVLAIAVFSSSSAGFSARHSAVAGTRSQRGGGCVSETMPRSLRRRSRIWWARSRPACCSAD